MATVEHQESLQVRFWGVRGSIAAAGAEFAEMGGNTPCVEVRVGDELIVFDAGTGIRALGAHHRPRNGHLFFSHLHWDHIQGFPFFSPAFVPGNHFTLHGPGKGAGRLLDALEGQMKPPTFPVTLEAMGARLDFSEVKDGSMVKVGPATVMARGLYHPDGCLGFRVQVGRKSVVYATDFEPNADGSLVPAAIELARGADVLVCDAQYTRDEYEGRAGPSRKGWGHNTIDDALRLAIAADVGTLVLFHHDPAHDDAKVRAMEFEVQKQFGATIAAREGMTLAI